jgi:hypothetical protein
MQFILGSLSMFPIRGTGLNRPYFSRFNLHLARRQKGCLSSKKCGPRNRRRSVPSRLGPDEGPGHTRRSALNIPHRRNWPLGIEEEERERETRIQRIREIGGLVSTPVFGQGWRPGEGLSTWELRVALPLQWAREKRGSFPISWAQGFVCARHPTFYQLALWRITLV